MAVGAGFDGSYEIVRTGKPANSWTDAPLASVALSEYTADAATRLVGTVAPDEEAVTLSGPGATPGPKTTCAAPSELAADPPVAVTFASAGGPRASFELVISLFVV